MKGFSEKEINDIFRNEDDPKPKKKDSKIKKYLPHIATGAILAVVATAIIIPLTTLKSDQKPDTDEKYEISPPEDFRYNISDGSVTIEKYIGKGSTVVVPDKIDNVPVRTLGTDAFLNVRNLERVILPEGLTVISDTAFSGESELIMVHLPETLESIGSNAFFDCTALEEITIPESVTSIGKGAFEACIKLKKVNIPEKITEIPAGLFKDCSSLSEIKLPDNTLSIGNGAFAGTLLKEIDLPDTLTSIGGGAFMNTDISFVTFPDSLETLGGGVFMNCINLKEVTLPEKITAIDQTTFMNCSGLTKVVLNDNITIIGNGAFSGCYSLESISLPSSLEILEPCAFQDCKALKSITLPDSLKVIEGNTFSGCEELREVVLPSSLEKIDYTAFEKTAIAEIVMPDTVKSIGSNCFYMCGLLKKVELSDNLESIGNSAFAYCSALSSVDIPASVKNIDDGAFKQCYNLAEISFSDGLETIGAEVFSGCTDLTKLVFPESLKEISCNSTFNKCTSLKEIIFPEGFEQFSNEDVIKFGTFLKCESLERIYFPASFKDEKIGGILCEVDASVVEIAEDNPTFTKTEESIVSNDGIYLYLLSRYTEIASGKPHDAKRFYTLPTSVISASEYAFVNIPYNSYIITSESFKWSSTDKYIFVNDDFVINTLKANNEELNAELSENIRDAFYGIGKNDPRFSVKEPIGLWLTFNLTDDYNGFSYPIKINYDNETDTAHYTAYIYSLKNKDKFSSESEGYIVAPKTYNSALIGEYGISFTTIIENDTFYDTNELTDYFLIRSKDEDYDNICDEVLKILERNNIELRADGIGIYESSMSLEYGDLKTITFLFPMFSNSSFHNALIEVYPVGYYGNNGEAVLTTEHGNIGYSVRIVDDEEGKIYY